jgi:parallel beta helix pectate lyase-like protein
VTVAAAPGQTPVLTSLFVAETNKWRFNGLKVQSLKPAALSNNYLVTIKDGGASLPTSDIVLENMSISSQDNVAAWSQAQWVEEARNGFSAQSSAGGANTKCVSLTGSHISNIRYGAALLADHLVFSNNQLDHFGGDAIDYGASNLAITKNNIRDAVDVGDGNHPDAMQGVLGVLARGAAFNYFRNVLIDSNLIIRQTDPGLLFPNVLQGIDAFDSDWTNVTVSNNVVVTSACWGIDFSSIHDSLIINNTVVGDGLMPTPGCTATVAIGDKTHEGPSSSNTALRNNLATRLIIYNLDPGVEADHNVIMHGSGGALIAWYSGASIQYLGDPGTYAGGNIIDSGGTASEFVNFNPPRLTYNMMLKSVAQAIGAGTTTGAPALDILGAVRTAPTTAGAYAFPY